MTTTDIPRGLTAAQIELLLQPIHPSRVRQLKNQSHLEAWDVRRWLTRIFGFGGWSDEILSCDLVHELTWPVVDDHGKPVPGKMRCTAVYRVTLRLTVRDDYGNVIGHWEDGATGDGVNQVSVGDAHDLALKTAMSQALKRCAVNLGDQFGLSLYNKGGNGAVVARTVAHSTVPRPEAPDEAQDAPVEGGELDDEHTGPEESTGPAPRATPRDRLVKPRGEDPWTQEPPATADEPKRPTKPMLTKLAVLAGKKRGIGNDREARLNLMRSFLPEARRAQIRSGNDLAFDEAKRIIDVLEREPDVPAPGGAPNVRNGGIPVDPGVEAALSLPSLAQLVERATAAEGVFEQLKALIREADTDAALERLILTALDAGRAGHITHGQYDALCEIGRERSEAIHSEPGWSARGVNAMAERTGAAA